LSDGGSYSAAVSAIDPATATPMTSSSHAATKRMKMPVSMTIAPDLPNVRTSAATRQANGSPDRPPCFHEQP
jgi:hypothetical protein